MRDVVIVSACRTPIGDFAGSLKSISATDLGALVIKEAVRRAGINNEEGRSSLGGGRYHCKQGLWIGPEGRDARGSGYSV